MAEKPRTKSKRKPAGKGTASSARRSRAAPAPDDDDAANQTETGTPLAHASAHQVPPRGAATPTSGGKLSKINKVKVPFPKKNQPPSESEFLARLPLPVGKKFDGVRGFLKKQKGVAEDLYFYGPKTGWAYRYLRGAHSLATIMIHDDRLMGILALDAAALAAADFDGLSDVGQRARKMAHGSPALLWLDLPLDGAGAADFKALLKAKLKVLPPPGPPPPPPPPAPVRD